MSTPFSSPQIERFKREAKQLHRDLSIPHSHALDRIAIEQGYGNWSLLMKHSQPDGVASSINSGRQHRFLRTPAQMRLALLKVPEPRGWGSPSRSDVAKARVDDISHDFASAQNAVQFAIDYVTCLLTVPRFKVYTASTVYWEMRAWLPYSAEKAGSTRILVNRSYKPVGQVGSIWANYEEFNHLHTQLTPEQCDQFKAPKASTGFLFNDGCPPWNSRADASAYLGRLHHLRDTLKR